MNIKEAKNIVKEIENKSITNEEDEFKINEALLYLFNETKQTRYIAYLGGRYYGNKKFDLALKYYEMAKELGYKQLNLALGYVWYYGRTGTKDYEKAYECFNEVIKCKTGQNYEKGQASKDDKREAQLKIADMYKNGYFVQKNYNQYKSIINNLYGKLDLTKSHNVFEKYLEIYLRKARLYEEENKIDEALSLYYNTKQELAIRLNYNLFFGDINQMSWTINDIYRLSEFDINDFDLYDLFYLLKEEHLVQFTYNHNLYSIESIKENDQMMIIFNNQYYHTFNDVLLNANIENNSLPFLYQQLEMFEIIH